MPWGIIVTVVFKLVDLILTRADKKKSRKEITEKQVEKFLAKHGDRYHLVRKPHEKKDQT